MSKETNKLLIVIPTAYPLGGVAVWLNYIVEGLSKLNWNIYVGAVNGKYHQADDYLADYSFGNAVLIDNPSGTRYGRVAAIRRAIQQVDADLVLSVNIPDVFDAVALCKKAGQDTKSVMTLHGLQLDYFQDIESMSANIDAVISTNLLTKEMVVEYAGFADERVFYAPYGVNVDSGRMTKAKAERPVILYAGRIEQPQKRCSDLLLLVQKLEQQGIDYELLIAGEGPEREQLISSLSLTASNGDITYIGQLSNQEFKNDVLPSADVLVLVSEWETGPIIIWEAMAAGLVVLTSRYIGSCSERALLDRQNCLLFDIGNIDQAIDQVLYLGQSGVSERLQEGGLSLVKSRYSLDASINAWNKALLEIVQNVTAKSSSEFSTDNWPKRGLIERLLGHKFGGFFRSCIGRSAYSASAGDEWPHSYGMGGENEEKRFLAEMHSLESKSS